MSKHKNLTELEAYLNRTFSKIQSRELKSYLEFF